MAFRIAPAGSRPALIWNIAPDTEQRAFAHSTSYCTQTRTSVNDTANRFWWADDLLKGTGPFALEMGHRCTFSWLRNSGFGPLRPAIKPTNWTRTTSALIQHNQGGEKTEHEIERETRQRINEPLIPKHKHSFAPTHMHTVAQQHSFTQLNNNLASWCENQTPCPTMQAVIYRSLICPG